MCLALGSCADHKTHRAAGSLSPSDTTGGSVPIPNNPYGDAGASPVQEPETGGGGQASLLGGAAGEGGSRAQGGAGGAAGAVAGAAGAAGSGGAAPLVSKYCGDAIRDPIIEECDDGPGDAADVCSADCRTRSTQIITGGGTGGQGGSSSVLSRSLGFGRHPVAANSRSFAVTYLDLGPDQSSVRVGFFNSLGQADGAPLEVSVHGAVPTPSSDPVIAELPGERYAVVWADLAGNSLDIALQVVSRGASLFAGPFICNQTTTGAQQDPDAIWTGTELLLAWSDGLDLRYRRLSDGATPLEGEQVLSATDAIESKVTLAAHRGTWAAAWRAGSDGLERIVVKAGDTQWMTAPRLPGPAGDHPALVELDQEHLLLFYTEGTAPLGGPATTGRLRAAVLDHAAAGEVESSPISLTVEPYASDLTLAQTRPALVRVQGKPFVAWESESPLGDVLGAEVWLAEIQWSALVPRVIVLGPEVPMGAGMTRESDQMAPGLAAVGQPAGGALVAVWETATGTTSASLTADLMMSVRPIPLLSSGSGLTDSGTP